MPNFICFKDGLYVNPERVGSVEARSQDPLDGKHSSVITLDGRPLTVPGHVSEVLNRLTPPNMIYIRPEQAEVDRVSVVQAVRAALTGASAAMANKPHERYDYTVGPLVDSSAFHLATKALEAIEEAGWKVTR